MALFQKGQAKTGGRRKGSRDKIATALLEAIAEDFAAHGAEVIKIARVERPTEYLKVVASLLPKEFEITDSRLKDIPDDELDALIEYARRRIANGIPRDTDGREEPQTH
jgi:transcriptional/translational regulatory protein YebC/TACO1